MFVQDQELPSKRWLFARWEGRLFLFVRESEVSPEVLEEAWNAYRTMIGAPPRPRLPSQRLPRARAMLTG